MSDENVRSRRGVPTVYPDRPDPLDALEALLNKEDDQEEDERTGWAEPEQDGVVDDQTLDVVGKALFTELQRRFQDRASIRDMPGTALIQLAKAYLQIYAERARTRPDENVPELSVLEIVRDAGLPDERKRELLSAEIDRLRAAFQATTEALANLKEGGIARQED